MIPKVLSKENIGNCEILFKTRPTVDNTNVKVPPPLVIHVNFQSLCGCQDGRMCSPSLWRITW